MSRGPVIAVTVLVAVAVALVALTLRPPDVPMYAPTAPVPSDAGRALVGPIVYTVDATSGERWSHFSFRVGAVVDESSPTGWDLAFRRYQIIANGGSGYTGRAGIRDLGPASFASVQTVPADGYQDTQGGLDPRNPAIAGWYKYGFFSHVLEPKPHVWAVRTTDGRYAKLEILGYYCPGAQPGCLTFRYVFQGDGSTRMAP